MGIIVPCLPSSAMSSGEAFDTLPNKSKFYIPQEDSGALHWQCASFSWKLWKRSRPAISNGKSPQPPAHIPQMEASTIAARKPYPIRSAHFLPRRSPSHIHSRHRRLRPPSIGYTGSRFHRACISPQRPIQGTHRISGRSIRLPSGPARAQSSSLPVVMGLMAISAPHMPMRICRILPPRARIARIWNNSWVAAATHQASTHRRGMFNSRNAANRYVRGGISSFFNPQNLPAKGRHGRSNGLSLLKLLHQGGKSPAGGFPIPREQELCQSLPAGRPEKMGQKQKYRQSNTSCATEPPPAPGRSLCAGRLSIIDPICQIHPPCISLCRRDG